MKRQISDSQLLCIQVVVGVAVTVLIYSLSVGFTCGFSWKFFIPIPMTPREIYVFCFLLVAVGFFNTGVFFNLVEFVLWRRGLRAKFVPRIPPGDLNPDWIIVPLEPWIKGLKFRFLVLNLIWFLLAFITFSYYLRHYCSPP